MKKRTFGIWVGMGLWLSTQAWALPVMQQAFLDKYPDATKTKLNSCATCHMPFKVEALNSYGAAYRDAKLDFAAIEGLPSAVAGKTNLDRIKEAAFPGSQVDDPEEFNLPAKTGWVHFNHGNHIMKAQYKILGNCSVCHSADAKAFAKMYDATTSSMPKGHGTCLACHKASGNGAAPTQCNDCHKK